MVHSATNDEERCAVVNVIDEDQVSAKIHDLEDPPGPRTGCSGLPSSIAPISTPG
jgi:hypothetical protein